MRFLGIFFFSYFMMFLAAAKTERDSLLILIKNSKQDTLTVERYLELAKIEFKLNQPLAKYYADKAIAIAQLINRRDYHEQAIIIKSRLISDDNERINFLASELSKAKKNEDAGWIIKLHTEKAMAYEGMDSIDLAIAMFNQSYEMSKEHKNVEEMVRALSEIGFIYKQKNRVTEAIQYYLKALKAAELYNYKEGYFTIYINLGTLYERTHDRLKAIDFYKNAAKCIDSVRDENAVAIVNFKLSSAYLGTNQYELAKTCIRKTVTIHKKRNDVRGLTKSLLVIAGLFNRLNQPDSAYIYAMQGLKAAEITKEPYAITSNSYAIAESFRIKKQYPEALKWLLKCVEINLDGKLSVLKIYEAIADVYLKMGDYKNCSKYLYLYKTENDSTYSEKEIQKQTELKMNYEFEKIQQQKILENKAKEQLHIQEIEAEKQRRNFLLSLLALFVLLIGVVFYYARDARKKNTLLAKQQVELFEKNKIVEEKSREIQNSISYSRNIQRAILPDFTLLKHYFSNASILYKPKDVVSGDFYWHKQIGDKLYIAIADCTGHGVPGAFMSIIGVLLLEEIILANPNYNSGEVLQQLNKVVINKLQQKNENESPDLFNPERALVKDGMDISFCIYNAKTKELQYSGANRPLWLLLKNQTTEISEVEYTKAGIGGHTNDAQEYLTSKFTLVNGDKLILFSDGVTDQFGGPKTKKYNRTRWNDWVRHNSEIKSFNEIAQVFDNEIEAWRGNNEQTDDMIALFLEV